MARETKKIKGPLGQAIFWLLFSGVIIILALSLFVNNLFLRYSGSHLQMAQMQAKVQAALTLTRTNLPDQYRSIVHLLRSRGLRAKLVNRPFPRGLVISNQVTIPQALVLTQGQAHLSDVSIQLADGKWLTLHSMGREPTWLKASQVLAVLILLSAVFWLCYGVFFSFTVPLKLISRATQRLAVDWEAPRLAMVGSAAMRSLIRSFNTMQQRIQKLVSDRAQMLAAITHDLRTPITRLQLRAEYLQGTDQYEKAVADLAEMEQMIQSILAFSKDYAHTETKSRLDLSALLQSLVYDMQAVGKQVEISEQEERIFYFGRMSALRRALTNVIENAIKYGKSATISLELRDDDSVCIQVRDHGPGIPEHDLERVFDPFYRCDAARTPNVGGSGLGLAVVRDIIQGHGGEVRLSNIPDGGLLVDIVLPASFE